MKMRCAARDNGKPCTEPAAPESGLDWPLCKRHLFEAKAIIESALSDDEGSTA